MTPSERKNIERRLTQKWRQNECGNTESAPCTIKQVPIRSDLFEQMFAGKMFQRSFLSLSPFPLFIVVQTAKKGETRKGQLAKNDSGFGVPVDDIWSELAKLKWPMVSGGGVRRPDCTLATASATTRQSNLTS